MHLNGVSLLPSLHYIAELLDKLFVIRAVLYCDLPALHGRELEATRLCSVARTAARLVGYQIATN